MGINYRREHFWDGLGTKRYFWLSDGIQRQPWTNHSLLLFTQTIPEVLAHKTCTENCAFWSSLRVINELNDSVWNKDVSSVDQLEFPIWFHFNTLIYYFLYIANERAWNYCNCYMSVALVSISFLLTHFPCAFWHDLLHKSGQLLETSSTSCHGMHGWRLQSLVANFLKEFEKKCYMSHRKK